MKVSVIGQGYVGLSLAIAASEFYKVVGFDTNIETINRLSEGFSHIEGVTNQTLIEKLIIKSYLPTSQVKHLDGSDVVVIAVPTPLTSDRKPDLKYLESACKYIGENLTKPTLIINESTSYPGTLRSFIKSKIENYSTHNVSHLYAVSPERIDPGRLDFTQSNTPRLYSGLTQKASELTKQFYSKFCNEMIYVSSPEIAEAAKLFENTFRQVNIALVNEFAQITHALGIDIYETLNAANTKPYGFMKFTPSAGVGGHCIPVDPTYLAEIAEQNGAPATFIRRANDVNVEMSKYVVSRIAQDHGGNLFGKKVLLVGVAYKPDVSDTRETAAYLVLQHLRDLGAIVSWHDDVVGTWNGESSTPLKNTDIVVVLTKHSSLSSERILEIAPYVFDTTGQIGSKFGL